MKKTPQIGEYWASPKGQVWKVYNILINGPFEDAILIDPKSNRDERISIKHLASMWAHVTEDGKPITSPPPEPLPTPKIEVGTVVRLKSGGPLMTVVSEDEDKIIGWWCFWFSTWGTEEKMASCTFPASCLDIVMKEVPDADPTVG